MIRTKKSMLAALLMTLPILTLATKSQAYVDLAPSIGKTAAQTPHIALVEVTAYDRAQHVVTLKEIRSIKGEGSTELIHHNIAGQGTAIPRPILHWAAPGSRAVLFVGRNQSLVCVGQAWYEVDRSAEGDWKLSKKDRPDLPLSYYGSAQRLADALTLMVAGKPAIVTVVAYNADSEGASFDLALHRQDLPEVVRVQRIRASLTMPATVMGAASGSAYYVGPGAVDESELPALTEALKSNDAGTRSEAAEDLRRLKRKAAPAADALAALLTDSDESVRLSAAAALLVITPKDTRGLDVLAKGMASTNASLRSKAIDEAGLAGAASGPLTEKIATLLNDSDESVRVSALQTISMMGPAAGQAAAAVTPLLDNPDFTLDAADALGHIGLAAKAALPKLATLLSSNDYALQWAAVRAMSQIGTDAAHPAVDFMIKALPKANEVEGYNMMIYLSLLGPVAKDAAPVIQRTALKNPVLPSSTLWAINADRTLPWQNNGGGMGGFGGRGGRGGPGGFGGGGGGGGPGGGGRGGPGGPGGAGPGDLNTLMYEAYVHELGYRLAPTAKILAQKLMDGSAGDMPDWGYKLLSCGPEEVLSIATPHLSDTDLAMRERAAVAIGYLGSDGTAARAQVNAALAKTSNEKEKKLMEWCLRAMDSD